MDDETVDLIIADPPYNIKKNFGNNSDHWENVENWLEWNKQWIDEAVRILKPTGSIFIYGYYENGFSGYRTLNAFYEPILWFTKTNKFTYHEIREPYKSKDRLKNKITKNGKVWTPNPDGRLAGDVWAFPTLAGKRFADEKVNHPTQKPLALCNRLIRHFSNKGNLVFIPFAGSGSECVSALANGRNFLATEINAEYIEIANHRIKQVEQIESVK